MPTVRRRALGQRVRTMRILENDSCMPNEEGNDVRVRRYTQIPIYDTDSSTQKQWLYNIDTYMEYSYISCWRKTYRLTTTTYWPL